jgi:hypothetical protein
MMALPVVTKEKVVKALDELPPEHLSQVNQFIEFLQFRLEQSPGERDPYGEDRPSVDKASMVDAQARQEMWQAALASTFGMWAGRDDVAQDGVEYVREIRRGHRLNDFLEQVNESD